MQFNSIIPTTHKHQGEESGGGKLCHMLVDLLFSLDKMGCKRGVCVCVFVSNIRVKLAPYLDRIFIFIKVAAAPGNSYNPSLH